MEISRITMKIHFAFIAFVAFNYALEVNAQCAPDQSDSFWYIGDAYGTKRVSDCSSNAVYNCHGFTRSYFENGCRPDPFIYYSPYYDCPTVQGIKTSDWRSNGRYVQICTESEADVAYYALVLDDHSAAKVGYYNGSFKYISKYGADGPLVSHALNGSVYNYKGIVNATTLWCYVGSINGSTNLIGTSPQTYSVQNKPGVIYYWYSSGSRISLSGPTNQNSVTVIPSHSGSATLTLRISSNCSSSYVEQSIAINVTTNICLEGSYVDSGNSTFDLNTAQSVRNGLVVATVTCPGASSYVWQKTGGNLSYYTFGNQVYFTMASGSSIAFNVAAKSGAVTLGNRNVTFYNYGYFRVSPNPASSSLQIASDWEASFGIELISDKNFTVLRKNDLRGDASIDLSDVTSGVYILIVYKDGIIVNRQRIKVEH